MSPAADPIPPTPARRQRPFRRAVLGGLAVALPPLLTFVLFVWVGSAINLTVFQPLKGAARSVLAWQMSEARDSLPEGRLLPDDPTVVLSEGQAFKRTSGGRYVPLRDYEAVRDEFDREPKAYEVYEQLAEQRYLQPWVLLPVFVCVFLLVLYFLGKFLAYGIGRALYATVERGIQRLPLIRNVYGSVKQVTDFLFTEQEIEYTRVVAVEYPRRGIWSLGMVTGESLLDIASAANEPVLSVLIPSSPMPVTGYTITVRKSEAVDLNITIDQAFQYIVSCGVVVPAQQVARAGQQPALTAAAGNGHEDE